MSDKLKVIRGTIFASIFGIIFGICTFFAWGYVVRKNYTNVSRSIVNKKVQTKYDLSKITTMKSEFNFMNHINPGSKIIDNGLTYNFSNVKNVNSPKNSILRKKRFSPWLDVSQKVAGYKLGKKAADVISSKGLKSVHLGFLVNPTNNEKTIATTWAGDDKIMTNVVSFINEFRKKGGDVVIALGGGLWQKQWTNFTRPVLLARMYELIIKQLKVHNVDIDIEEIGGSSIYTSNNAYALSLLQKKLVNDGYKCSFSLTVPVAPESGLIDAGNGVNYEKMVKTYLGIGVNFNTVNIMTMSIGDLTGQNFIDSIRSTKHVVAQQINNLLSELGKNKLSIDQLNRFIAVTPELGLNDDGKTLFDLKTAKLLAQNLSEMYIYDLEYWSLNRDTLDDKLGNDNLYTDKFSYSSLFTSLDSKTRHENDDIIKIIGKSIKTNSKIISVSNRINIINPKLFKKYDPNVSYNVPGALIQYNNHLFVLNKTDNNNQSEPTIGEKSTSKVKWRDLGSLNSIIKKNKETKLRNNLIIDLKNIK